MVMSEWSVNLTTLFLSRLRPPEQLIITKYTYTVSGHKYFIKMRIPIDFNAFFSVQEN